MPSRMTRRKFLITAGGALAAGGLGGYSFRESGALEPRFVTVPIVGLPPGFDGFRIAFLSDLHRSWFITGGYISSAVSLANSFQPDIALLGGDYINSDPAYIAPIMEELGGLKAPLGIFAVQGNRDIRVNRLQTTNEFARRGIQELTNRNCRISRNGDGLWLCGIDDSTIGHPDVGASLDGMPPDAVAVAITHNPDLTESLEDTRIRLVCCGHTHGGQINLPVLGRPLIFSRHGQKYALGLVQAPHTKVFTTTGVGSVFPPFRFRCPPEVALLTLVRA